DELGIDVLSQLDDLSGERAPVRVRLHAQEENRVPPRRVRRRRHRRVIEGVLRPVNVTRHAVDERDVRPHRLEIEEILRVDVGEALGVPGFRQVAGRQRGALRAVVPAAESGYEHRPAECRPTVHAEVLTDAGSLEAWCEAPVLSGASATEQLVPIAHSPYPVRYGQG